MEQAMNYCDDCNVYVDGCLEYCPLCGKRLTDSPSENELYPDVAEKKFVDRRSLLSEYLALATFIIIALCIVINLLTWNRVPWFLAVAAPVLYAWVLIRIVIISDLSAGLKTLLQMLALIGMFLSFDYVVGKIGWSYEVMMPLILSLGIAYIDFYSYFHKSRWRENLLYAFLFLLMGFVPLILYLCGIWIAMLPLVLCTFASGITILGIVRFALRQFKSEMQKKFHM